MYLSCVSLLTIKCSAFNIMLPRLIVVNVAGDTQRLPPLSSAKSVENPTAPVVFVPISSANSRGVPFLFHRSASEILVALLIRTAHESDTVS